MKKLCNIPEQNKNRKKINGQKIIKRTLAASYCVCHQLAAWLSG